MLPDKPMLHQELTQLEQEHQELNEVIDDQLKLSEFDQLTIQRVKKRKLYIKDRITYLKGFLFPDIIA